MSTVNKALPSASYITELAELSVFGCILNCLADKNNAVSSPSPQVICFNVAPMPELLLLVWSISL